MRKVFELGTKKITLDGTEFVPIPLFEALDGNDSRDYVERVEPSAIGGKKLAIFLLDKLLGSKDHDKGN